MSALAGQVTAHFAWTELDVTEVRRYVGPNAEALAIDLAAQFALTHLCREFLEPIRAWWGSPLIITSAYRMRQLNTAIGGNVNSQHMKGEAVDFHVVGVPLSVVFERIVQSDLPFGQAILEPVGPGARWIHLSLGEPFRTQHNRQVIR